MACGNNMVSRANLQSAPVAVAHPSVPLTRNSGWTDQVGVDAAKRAQQQVFRADEAVSRASTAAAVKSALREANTALAAARRTRGGNETKKELRQLEKRVEDLRRSASKKEADIAQHEQRDRDSIAVEAYRQIDHLAPRGLGVVPGVQLLEPRRVGGDSHAGAEDLTVTANDLAVQGLARSLPRYSDHVNRRDQAPHVAREDWQPERDPLPSHGDLGLWQRVVSVARTVDGDVAFLNQDGIPVAARLFLSPGNPTGRDGWMQRKMQQVFRGEHLDAGHMGPLFAGAPHLVEFVTGQAPGFNRGAQGGFENAIAKAPAGTVSIEVSVVVDAPLGISQPKGYWFEAIAVGQDGTRQPVRDATRYYAQRE